MLKQLEQLSKSAEGRYATVEELEFLQNYLPTVDLRISAYQKLRDAEDKIIDRLQEKMQQVKPGIFHTKSGDLRDVCRRDIKVILRNATAAMLIDDLDRLRENILLWQRIIIKAFKEKHIATMVHTTMPEIIEQFLTPEEFATLQPVLQLNQAILAD